MKFYFGRLAVSSLGVIAYGIAFAQDTINVPAATYYQASGFVGNTVFTSAATSSYIMGAEVRVTSSLPNTFTSIQFSAPALRIRNSAFPDRVLDVGAATAAGSPAGPRFGRGSLAGSPITAGSTFIIECFNYQNSDPAVFYTVSAYSLTTTAGVEPAKIVYPPAMHEVFLPGTNFTDPSLPAIAGEPAMAPFVLGPRVIVRGGLIKTLFNQLTPGPVLIVRHTAYPDDAMVATLGGSDSGEFTLAPYFSRFYTGTGSLIGKVIPTSGNFTYQLQSSSPQATITDLKVDLTEGSSTQTYSTTQTLLCAGPIGNINNGRASLGFVPETFTGGHRLWIGGTVERVGTASAISESGEVRIKNSAFPGVNLEVLVSADDYPSVAPFRVFRSRDWDPAKPPTYGLVFPQGSEFTVEAYSDQTDQNGRNQWLGVRMEITSDPDVGYLAYPAVDLGVVSTNSPVNLTVEGIRNGTPRWYRFSVPTGIDASSGNWMDIFTDGTPNTNTQISLYRANGALIASDDDDGNGNYSALSFGTGSGIPPSTGVISSNGRDGSTLAPGDYYVAVSRWLSTIASPFDVTSSGLPINGVFQLRIQTNRSYDQLVSSTLIGPGTSFAAGLSRTISYTWVQNNIEYPGGNVDLYWSTTPATLRAPVSLTGVTEVVLDGGAFLRRRVSTTLTGLKLSVGSISLVSGDVDNSGEIDAADIDAVIAVFGQTSDTLADVDLSAEVDAADIDMVIANFGATDE